ncbi:MAG: hypothetical protein HDR95_05315, partial [Bacteroides sp.]|nr:hypothetical protein [Bacteroides sp.]
SLEGSKEPEATAVQLMYSYENVSKSGETTLPVISIEYEQDGAVRTHEVQLIDPEAPAGTVLPIKRNHLYRLVLTKAGKLNFNLEVADWEEADAFGKSDLNEHLILPLDEQQKLNEQLLVYDLFTEYNVKSISDDNVVTFYDTHIVPNHNVEDYFILKNIKEKKLISKDKLLEDASGKKYRMPTAGELQLLFPQHTQYIQDTSDPNYVRYHVDFSGINHKNKTVESPFVEKIYLKNDNNNLADKTGDITTESEYGFTGTTQLRKGRINRTIYYDASNNLVPPDISVTTLNRAPAYGIRFKHTTQYSAYKWEIINISDNPQLLGLSVKIKALPQDAELTIYDISDNHAFWKEGYVEYIFPFDGYLGPDNVIYSQYTQSSIISSTLPQSNGALMRALLSTDGASIYPGISWNAALSLRLVKVSE